MSSIKNKRLVVISLIFIVGVISTIFYLKSNSYKNDTIESLINIQDLSEEYMDNYYKEYQKIENEDKENMLIVISSKKLKKEDYNANNIIEAPNNKYYLVFNDEISKENALIKLKKEDYVHSAEENIIRKTLVTDTVTESETTNAYNSWGIETMGLDYAHEELSAINLNDVTVAIIDTGLDVTLFNKYYPDRLAGKYNVLDGSTTMYDNYGHGTHIAGTIAEGTPNNVKILPVKVSDTSAIAETDILLGLDYITYNGNVDVVNLSFGGYEYSEAQYQAIEAAKQNNIIFVAAAGNENVSDPMYPAGFSNTISIASIDSNNQKSEFSNYGETIQFTAPGTDIKSIMGSYTEISKEYNDGDDDHQTISGTSMATPHAVCSVAILKSLSKEIDIEGAKELLKEHTIDLGGQGFDIYYGNGLINYGEANFCLSEEMHCDEYQIFKELKPTSMEVPEVKLTKYNYGSITNILATEVNFEEIDGQNYTKTLWELEDINITGYDPYKEETQTVTINYQDLETTIEVTNPTNYESGWEYQLYNEKYYLSNYKDNELNIGKLYLPEKIDELTISGILNDTNKKSILFENSTDAKYFEEIILPENITEVGSYAFYELEKCSQITSKADEIIINKYSFANMTNLTTVEGKVIFTEDGSSEFENDISLKNIVISDNTYEKLPSYAFENCSSLTEITLPNVITEIGSSAFEETSLTDIIFPPNLKTIGNWAFKNAKLVNVDLPETLETIKTSAFSDNNIQSVKISKNVSLIDGNVFSFNENLESIIIDSENKTYSSGDNGNVIIENSTNKVIQGSNNPKIPNTVTTIGELSFAGLGVKEIDLPEGVTTIEDKAFYWAGYLEKVTLPTTITTISDLVFDKFEDLEELLGSATSGHYTGIGKTVLWVHKDSFAHQYAVEKDKTYVVIENSDNIIDIQRIYIKTKKMTFYPGEKVEDYVEHIKVEYLENEEIKELYIEDYTIEYINGDCVTLDDFYVNYTFSLENSYQNLKSPMYINVIDTSSEIKLPTIEAVIGDYICKYEFEEGTFEPYQCGNYTEPGDYVLDGDLKIPSTGETISGVFVNVKVLNKYIVHKFANSILAKIYDGTTDLGPNSVTLSSYDNNIQPEDYTIISATLASPEVSMKTLVNIKAKINDESFSKYAFANNTQEAEFTAYTAVVDFEIPEATLLLGEEYYSTPVEGGSLHAYGTYSYDEPGNYTIVGYYMSDDGSITIDGIPIPVKVINKKIVYQWAEITDKVYDGTTNIDLNTIKIDGLAKENYTILSASLESPDVTEWGMAKIKMRLSDEFYENNAFSGDLQEVEWYNPIKIVKATPEYTVPKNIKAELNQNLYDIELPSGFEWTSENQLLSELGSKTFKAKYSHTDTKNYQVIEDIDITIEVVTKLIKYTANDYIGIYDGKEHTIDIKIETPNTEIKYSLDNIDYNISELPKFTDAGEYDLYYKINAEGYDEVIGSNKIKIYGIEKIDESITVKDNLLIIENNSLNYLTKNIDIYAETSFIKHLNDKKEELTDDLIKTGEYIIININNTKDFEYQLVYLGDVNSNGEVDIIDYIRIMKYIMEEIDLSGVYYEAADYDRDGSIGIVDYIRIMKLLMEEE